MYNLNTSTVSFGKIMPDNKRPLKVFLCHAHDDKEKTRDLYRYLRRRSVQPWLDSEDLVGGQDWREEIPRAIRASDVILICLSKNSINKEGFVQSEINFALEKALEIPQKRIFIVPVRYEECEVPSNLERYHWVDLFEKDSYSRLMKSLNLRAKQLERVDVELLQSDETDQQIGSVLDINKKEAAFENHAGEEDKINGVQERLDEFVDKDIDQGKSQFADGNNEIMQTPKNSASTTGAKKAAEIHKRSNLLFPGLFSIGTIVLCLIFVVFAIIVYVVYYSPLTNVSNLTPTKAIGYTPTKAISYTPTSITTTSFIDVRTALDEDGAQPTSIFSAFDTVYVVGNLSNGVAGNQVTSRWFFDNVPGFESGALIDESTIDVTEESFNGTVFFYFPPQTDGWPAGSYKVEVYFNNVLNSTVFFTVQ